MGRRKRRRKHKQQPNQHQCNNQRCNGDCKKEPEAEIIEIEDQEQLEQLCDIILKAGMYRTARFERKQKQLNNALLEDAGIPIPSATEVQTTTIVTDDDDDSAI